MGLLDDETKKASPNKKIVVAPDHFTYQVTTIMVRHAKANNCPATRLVFLPKYHTLKKATIPPSMIQNDNPVVDCLASKKAGLTS